VCVWGGMEGGQVRKHRTRTGGVRSNQDPTCCLSVGRRLCIGVPPGYVRAHRVGGGAGGLGWGGGGGHGLCLSLQGVVGKFGWVNIGGMGRGTAGKDGAGLPAVSEGRKAGSCAGRWGG